MNAKMKNVFLKIEKQDRIVKAILMSLLPLLYCIIVCAVQGAGIRDVYLPSGEWNDELFYYKQVEGIVNYGYPLGYFGFNESHALKYSFAAWSPVLLVPWVVWGWIFGWNMSSPIICNIFIMMLAMFLFVWLTNPSKKQLGCLAILYILFAPLSRYMLSGMPECTCFALVIIVVALFTAYQKEESLFKLILLFILTSIMTLMRPYLILFMLFPVYLFVRKKGWIGGILSLVIMGGTVFTYFIISHFLCAQYFTPLFDTTWITTFITDGLFEGIEYVILRLCNVGKTFFGGLTQGFKGDLFYGEYFAAFGITMIMLIWQLAKYLKEKNKKQLVIFGIVSFGFVAMWIALLLMYKMQEGSKHLLTFIVAGIYTVCLVEKHHYRKILPIAAVFLCLFYFTDTDSYEHQVPFKNDSIIEESEYWEEVFENNCELDSDQEPGFKNVIIWTYSDLVDDKNVVTPYQMLYQLPSGFGISCCYAEYVLDNMSDLKSRFLAVPEEGEIDKLCRNANLMEIGRNKGLVVYELYDYDRE